MSQNKQRSAVDYPNAGQLRRLVAIRQSGSGVGTDHLKQLRLSRVSIFDDMKMYNDDVGNLKQD